MTKYFCDICKKEMPDEGSSRYCTAPGINGLNVCNKCGKKVANFIGELKSEPMGNLKGALSK